MWYLWYGKNSHFSQTKQLTYLISFYLTDKFTIKPLIC